MHIFKVEIIVTHARLSQDYMPTKKSMVFSGNHHKLSLLNEIKHIAKHISKLN